MISKELLQEVLGWKIEFVNPRVNDNEVSFVDNTGDRNSLNIHYVAHVCKIWSHKQGFIVSSGLTPVLGINGDGWAEVYSSTTSLDEKVYICKQYSEPEAIFQACQWVLDNKEIR